MLPYGSDFNVGQDNYMMYTGFSSVLSPLSRQSGYESTKAYANYLFDRAESLFTWDALSREDYYVDYQNRYTFLASSSQRYFFYRVANVLIRAGEWEKAVDIIEKGLASVPESQYPYDTILSDFATNDQVVSNLVGLCYEAALGAAEAEDTDTAMRATALGDSLAGRYGDALAANAPATHNSASLARFQGDYGEEMFYLAYELLENSDLPREDTAAFDDLFDRVGRTLADHLHAYAPYPGAGVSMTHPFIRLTGEKLLFSRDSLFIRRLAPYYAEVIARDPAPTYDFLKTQYGFIGYLIPEDVFGDDKYGTNWLDEKQSASLKKSLGQKLAECRTATPDELEEYLSMVENLSDKEWISVEDAIRAIGVQKDLLKASRGDSIDDFYDVYSICAMLDGLWDARDYRTYNDAVFRQAKATWRYVQDAIALEPEYQEEYERYFFGIADRLVQLKFLSQRQVATFRSSVTSGGYYRN